MDQKPDNQEKTEAGTYLIPNEAEDIGTLFYWCISLKPTVESIPTE
jgi:hypothetical protein